jgi:hypothetical protein
MPDSVYRDTFGTIRSAFAAFCGGDSGGFDSLLGAAKGSAEGDPALLGEWIMLSSLPLLRRPSELCRSYTKARSLIHGFSRVFPRECPLALDYECSLAFYLTEPGAADRVADDLRNAAQMYQKLTGGGGTGADFLYSAQLSFFRGNFDKANSHAVKAVRLAGRFRQHMVLFCAAELLARIALYTLDMPKWQMAVNIMNRACQCGKAPTGNILKQLYCLKKTGLSLHMRTSQKIPVPHSLCSYTGITPSRSKKTLLGNYCCPGSNIHYQNFPSAVIVNAMFNMHAGNYACAVDIINGALDNFFIAGSVINSFYFDMIRAACYSMLGNGALGDTYLDNALTISATCSGAPRRI